MRSVTLAALVLALVGLLLAGCGQGPSQVGAAAIVDSATVTLDDVHARVQTALRNPQAASQVKQAGQLDALTRNIVTDGVQHLLLAEAARREHLVVTDRQVAQVIGALGGPAAASANTIYDASTVSGEVRDQLLAIALAEKYFDHLVVQADVAAVSTQAQADNLARAVAADPRRAVAILTGSSAVIGVKPDLRVRADDDPGTATTPLFGVPAGDVVVFETDTGQGGDAAQGGWFVGYVTSRVTDAPAPAPGDTSAQLAREVDQQTLAAVGQRLLQPLAMSLGVRVNPRYGEWDPVQLRVVASGTVSGEVIPVHAARG